MKEQLRVYLFILLGMMCFCTGYIKGEAYISSSYVYLDFMFGLAIIFLGDCVGSLGYTAKK
mgnify:CR=1 FL=1